MSLRVRVAGSESIDGIGRRGRPDVGLEALATNDIDRAVEEFCNVILERDVFIDADAGGGIDLDHDIDVTVGAVVAPRARAEQSRVTDAARAQGGFIFPQPGKDLLTIHLFKITFADGLCQILWLSGFCLSRKAPHNSILGQSFKN